MEFITDYILKNITINPPRYLNYNNDENEESRKVNQEFNELLVESFRNDILKNPVYKNFFDSCSHYEYNSFFNILIIKYFFKQVDRTKLAEQLSLCESIINSDICKRNEKLKNEIVSETEKLKLALKTDLVMIIIYLLDDLFKKSETTRYVRERYVKISTVLSLFKIHIGKPYLTLDEAEEYILIHPELKTTDGTAFIYNRIKKDIEKINRLLNNS